MATTRTHFYWANAPEGWQQFALLLLAVGLGWWAWRRYGPAPLGATGAIARLCRVTAAALAVALIAAPSWRTTTITVLPAKVVVAVDRSASMQRQDWQATPDAPVQARSAAAGELHRALSAIAGPRQLTLDWQSIGGVSGTLTAAELASGPSATGAASPLAEDLLRVVAERRPDLLVLVSDGRITEGPGFATVVPALRARELRLAVLALGGEAIDPALIIDDLVVNKQVALGEIERIKLSGLGRALVDGPVTVRLWIGDQLSASREVTPDPPAVGDSAGTRLFSETLEAVFSREGPTRVRIEVEQGVLKDSRELTVVAREQKLQVLLLDLKPRYELRYLREALKRDHTITVHSYLFEGRKIRWGADGPDRLPLTAAELRDYDVIVLGDLGPEQFDAVQMKAIEDAVKKQGCGLVWLPGDSGSIAGFAKHALGSLVPATLPDAATIARGYLAGVPRRLQRSSQAVKQGLFESPDVDWNRLPELLGGLILAPGDIPRGSDVLMEDQEGRPVVVTRPYGVGGAGRSILVGVDDTWRWRRNVGDLYLHRFYSQLMRFAAVGRRHGPPWRIVASPRRAVPGELVTVSLNPKAGLEEAETRFDATSVLMVLDGTPPVEQALRLVPDDKGYSARLPAPAVGTWRISPIDGPGPGQVEDGELLVLPPTSEVRDPRADRAALDALATGIGGRVYRDLRQLVENLPDVRKSREEVQPPAGLWDNPWALAALVLLLGLEWSIRRWKRLP